MVAAAATTTERVRVGGDGHVREHRTQGRGLGTRAVDRSDDDYTRVVALNAPQRRPESDAEEVRQFSQRRVDVIDLDAGDETGLIETPESAPRARPAPEPAPAAAVPATSQPPVSASRPTATRLWS